jgi:hypothetical protein
VQGQRSVIDCTQGTSCYARRQVDAETSTVDQVSLFGILARADAPGTYPPLLGFARFLPTGRLLRLRATGPTANGHRASCACWATPRIGHMPQPRRRLSPPSVEALAGRLLLQAGQTWGCGAAGLPRRQGWQPSDRYAIRSQATHAQGGGRHAAVTVPEVCSDTVPGVHHRPAVRTPLCIQVWGCASLLSQAVVGVDLVNVVVCGCRSSRAAGVIWHLAAGL